MAESAIIDSNKKLRQFEEAVMRQKKEKIAARIAAEARTTERGAESEGGTEGGSEGVESIGGKKVKDEDKLEAMEQELA